MDRLSTIELFKEDMRFSAGHFTIFSSTVRENLHGHNYQVYVAYTTTINEEGLSFDYRIYKDKMANLCLSLNETIILPRNSKYLTFSESDDYHEVIFNQEKLLFLKRDVTLLPITNATVEELSNWFIQQLILDQNELVKNKITHIKVKVYSGPGQSGSATWTERGFQPV